MRASSVPVMSAEPNRTCARPAEVLAQPVAAATVLLVLIWALSDGVWPTWPLWTIAAVLVLGLVAGPLAPLTGIGPGRRSAQPAAAFLSLLILSFALPDAHPGWPVSPLWIVAFLLGGGLVAGPLSQLANGRLSSESARPIPALVAILVLIWNLSVDGYWFLTASSGTLSVDRLPVATFRIVILALALIATVLIRSRTARAFLTSAAIAAALVMLLLTLAFPPVYGLRPVWPLWLVAATVALCLGTDVLRWARSLPRATVLAERVDELSRTRSGALDVQAIELRRIERDLHDGAQVRLVALSLKLGRAEDRYRDDPETAALLREAREDATAAIRGLRELARGIAPPVLANRGLDAAVRSLAQRSGVKVTVTSQLDRRPPPVVERAAYFVVAESLANVAKYAADARVEIDLDDRGGALVVEVTDFGPGGADPAGTGLTGLRQRVEALDGMLSVTSPEGVGTQIEAVLPCEP
jgi:signal transduction histidine kinase